MAHIRAMCQVRETTTNEEIFGEYLRGSRTIRWRIRKEREKKENRKEKEERKSKEKEKKKQCMGKKKKEWHFPQRSPANRQSNSSEQETKLVYAIRATRGYRNLNFSSKFQKVGVFSYIGSSLFKSCKWPCGSAQTRD